MQFFAVVVQSPPKSFILSFSSTMLKLLQALDKGAATAKMVTLAIMRTFKIARPIGRSFL
jgi:hypothetical protein